MPESSTGRRVDASDGDLPSVRTVLVEAAGAEDGPERTVVESELAVPGRADGSPLITGWVRNAGNEPVTRGQGRVKFTEASGTLLAGGTGWTNLGGGEVWPFADVANSIDPGWRGRFRNDVVNPVSTE